MDIPQLTVSFIGSPAAGIDTRAGLATLHEAQSFFAGQGVDSVLRDPVRDPVTGNLLTELVVPVTQAVAPVLGTLFGIWLTTSHQPKDDITLEMNGVKISAKSIEGLNAALAAAAELQKLTVVPLDPVTHQPLPAPTEKR